MTADGALLSLGLLTCAAGAVGTFTVSRRHAPHVLGWAGALAALLLLAAGAAALASPAPLRAPLWSLPGIGPLSVGLDRLSAFFLIVTGLVAAPCAVFAAWHTAARGERYPRAYPALYLALLASIALVCAAGDAFLFLIAWEAMSILIYLLIVGKDGERPGYLMLAVGEAGTLAVVAAFLLMAAHAGSCSFGALRASGVGLSEGARWAVFLLAFFGFGVKAGLAPVNFWLQRAYRAAPAGFTPLLAGATLNLGLYGLMRVTADLLPAGLVGAGVVALLVGAVTAFLGILYASIDDDLKSLLAHSSIENAGIITAAFGASMVFGATGHPVPAAIALIAALYHLLNHSVYKALLFMGAGAVEDSAGTRSLDRLGGLLRTMPCTGLFLLVGALAIAAIPPFNGFVSEWLTLQSLLRSVELASLGVKLAFVGAGVALALTAGLAVTCFVRLFAMGMLGTARSEEARQAREVGRPALATMAALAVACLALGALPTYVIPAVDRVAAPLTGASGAHALVPPFFRGGPAEAPLPAAFAGEFHDLGAQVGQPELPGRGLVVLHRGGEANPVVFAMSTSYMLVALIGLLGLTAGLVWLLAARKRRVERRAPWAGGVREFLPEMTYTATGFAQPVRVIFEAVLRPATVEDSRKAIAEHFRVTIRRLREEYTWSTAWCCAPWHRPRTGWPSAWPPCTTAG